MLRDLSSIDRLDVRDKPRPMLLPLVDLSAWAGSSAQAQPWIIDKFIPQGEVTFFTGPGGANKSTFALQLCACLSAGKPMLGHAVPQMKALFLTIEDDEREGHWRLERIARTIGASISEMRANLHIAILRGRLNNELATFDQSGRIVPSDTYSELRETIAATGVDFVVLDNVGQLFVGNENDRAAVTRFVNLLTALCQEFGVTILLVAHPSKSGASYSGSTAWPSAVRSHLFMNHPDGEIDPDVRAITTDKSNRARRGEKIDCRWHDFALVRDSDLPEDMRAEMAAAAAAANANGAFLACLRARAAQGEGRQVGPSSGANYAPSQFEGMAEAKGLDRRQLKQAMDRLFTIGRIRTATMRNKAKGRDVTIIEEVPEHSPNASPNGSRTPTPDGPERQPDHPRAIPEHTPLLSGEVEGASKRPSTLPLRDAAGDRESES